MLKRIQRETDHPGAVVKIREAAWPAPFKEGLEYSSPARGTWNIVHTGMLIPESHQIFVCALGCLRGVVLTAAEMNAMDRYSSVIIREENVLDGTMEELMIGGVTDVLEKLPYRPKAVLLFISCQHFFLAYDQQQVFAALREKFPDIRFTDCYMIPTLRKSGLTPDQKMRMQLYSMLEDGPKDPRKINLIGSNLPVSRSSELVWMLENGGYTFQSIHDCHTFEEYLAMAQAGMNLFYEPLARIAAEDLEKRLHQPYLYMPFTFDDEELSGAYQRLAETLHLPELDEEPLRKRKREALLAVRELIGDTPVAVDYTLTFRILSLVKLLLTYGFHVTEIYADAFLPEEKADFEWIRENYPEIRISSCVRPWMRFQEREREEKVLALGQKAAYFTGTDYFVNLVESGGLYGYDGVVQLAGLMRDAFLNRKDRKTVIQRKGLGCESCI